MTKMVGAYTEVPYSKALANELTFVDSFDLKYELFRRDGDQMWLPRNYLPWGAETDYDDGQLIDVGNFFEARSADQARVIDECHALLDGGEDFIINAPTGYGKTYLGAELISYLKTRTLIITTKEDIIDQWSTAITKTCGLHSGRIGIWRGNHEPKPEHDVVIALVQSIMKGPERYPEECFHGFGLVLADEVHRMGAEKFSNAMWWFGAPHRVGLSATPYRRDGRDNTFHFHISSTQVLAEQDVMQPKVIVKNTGWVVPMVNWGGEFQRQPHEFGKTMGLEVKMGQNKRRNQIITEFCHAAVAKGRNTIVFASNIKHLHTLEKDFLVAGIKANRIGYYVGLTNYKGKHKEEQRQRAKNKPLILATYSMAAEATDIPWLDCCVLASPRADVVQCVGRIRREWEGKKQPVVFDLVDQDSHVFKAYWQKRKRWYDDLGAPIIVK